MIFMNDNIEKEKKEKRKTLLIAIITVVVFIATSVAATYAFLTATIIGNSDNGDVTIKTAKVYAVYNATNSINDSAILPGYSNTLEFSIVNTSETTDAYGNYSLIWEIEKNELDDPSFVYTLTGETVVNNETVANNSISHNSVINIAETRVPKMSTVIGTGLINTGVTHNYRLTISFKETGDNQDSLQSKELKSYITAKGEPTI